MSGTSSGASSGASSGECLMHGWGIIWGMSGASWGIILSMSGTSGAFLGHHLGHFWGIIWGMSGATSEVCLGHHLGQHLGHVWEMSGACLGYLQCYMHLWFHFLAWFFVVGLTMIYVFAICISQLSSWSLPQLTRDLKWSRRLRMALMFSWSLRSLLLRILKLRST